MKKNRDFKKSIKFWLEPYMILKNEAIKEKCLSFSRNFASIKYNKTEESRVNHKLKKIQLNNLFQFSNDFNVHLKCNQLNLFEDYKKIILSKKNHRKIQTFIPMQDKQELKASCVWLKKNLKKEKERMQNSLTIPNVYKEINFLLSKIKASTCNFKSRLQSQRFRTPNWQATNPILKNYCLLTKYKRFHNNVISNNKSLLAHNNLIQRKSFLFKN